MYKMTKEDRTINCSACGYNTCEEMVTAIYNGVNVKDNCIHFVRTKYSGKKEVIVQKNEEEKEEQRRKDIQFKRFWKLFSRCRLLWQTRRQAICSRPMKATAIAAAVSGLNSYCQAVKEKSGESLPVSG